VQETIERQALFRKHGIPGATWVETGTYRGDTTEFLAGIASAVYSFEPGVKLYEAACQRFKGRGLNVMLINRLSEEGLPQLLPWLSGDVCFWLDGHYSGEDTYKGPQDTPIRDELAAIGGHIARWSKVVVFIDDVHLFTGAKHVYGRYPKLDGIAMWAQNHKLAWHIDSDIFIAKNL
jgi:hypothetical protein